MGEAEAVDVLVVGAGFGGLYALHKLRDAGFTVRGVEAGDGVGGTWYWNRYPGARCDVESFDYSFSLPDLQQDWRWTERYAAQPEILSYLEHVAERLELLDLLTFNSRIVSASWDDGDELWRAEADTGETILTRQLILATGALSAAKRPDIDGVEAFEGRVLNTSSWPRDEVDLGGLRVGVIGTGSSGIQAIPVLAEQAAELFVFQRTPAFSIPARNAPLDPAQVEDFKGRYNEHRRATRETPVGVIHRSSGKAHHELDAEAQYTALEEQWTKGGGDFAATFTNQILDEHSNAVAAEFVRNKIRDMVKDPATAEKLTPRDYPIGAKRLCLDTRYYETFNRPNVRLVDLRANPIERIAANGVQTQDALIELDALVFATGFDAMTGALLRIDVRGANGVSLREKWAAGPLTFLGLMVADFPNLFMVTGPGSPSVLTNMVAAIEQHVDWITDCLVALRTAKQSVIEAGRQAEHDWVVRVNALAAPTLFMKGDSWYLGANVPGKARVFMPYIGGLASYRRTCDRIAADGYKGFARR